MTVMLGYHLSVDKMFPEMDKESIKDDTIRSCMLLHKAFSSFKKLGIKNPVLHTQLILFLVILFSSQNSKWRYKDENLTIFSHEIEH